MTAGEMTDAEAREQVARTDRFIAALREMIASTIVPAASRCANEQRRGLQRIAQTLDAVDYTTLSNLANLDAAMGGAVLSLCEVRLMAVGAGPTLDYPDAVTFLAEFQPMIDMALKRRLQ